MRYVKYRESFLISSSIVDTANRNRNENEGDEMEELIKQSC